MPWPARVPHRRAPSQMNIRFSVDKTKRYAQLKRRRPSSYDRRQRVAHDEQTPPRLYRSPRHHHRHLLSVASATTRPKDFEKADDDEYEDEDDGFDNRLSLFAVAASISPLSPRWSLVLPDTNTAVDAPSSAMMAATQTRPHMEDRILSQSAAEPPTAEVLTPASSTTAVASARHSAASVDSLLSGTTTVSTLSTTSTTTALQRFWSPSPSSPPSSPPSPPLFAPRPGSRAASPTSATASTWGIHRPSAPPVNDDHHVVTYIPPLVDLENGSLYRWQRRAATSTSKKTTSAVDSSSGELLSNRDLLEADLRWLVGVIPKLLGRFWMRCAWPLLVPIGVVHQSTSAPPRPSLWSLTSDDLADASEGLLQLALGLGLAAMLVAAPIFFLCLPGAFFLAWLCTGVAAAWVLSWPLNRGGTVPTTTPCPWAIDDDDTHKDETWIFVSGMGATSRSLARTGPRLAGSFGRPVIVVRPGRTYGAAVDFARALLQRLLLALWELPSPGMDVLYYEVRRALARQPCPNRGRSGDNNDRPRRVVILAHNTGATTVTQVLARLKTDMPVTQLAGIEVYTFGSLAPDFVLATSAGTSPGSSDGPYVEHVTHVRDPCACFGVLRSVHDDLAGRYGGGVFVLGNERTSSAGRQLRSILRRSTVSQHSRAASSVFSVPSDEQGSPLPSPQTPQHPIQRSNRPCFPLPQQKHDSAPVHRPRQSIYLARSLSMGNSSRGGSCSGSAVSNSSSKWVAARLSGIFSMEDYLTALFGPEPWSMRPDIVAAAADNWQGAPSSSAASLFVDATVVVDRELAERREMAVLAPSQQGCDTWATGSLVYASATASRSWTGLGAMASPYTVVKGAGSGSTLLLGLETTRKRCRACEGRPGRDVSQLAGYFMEAVAQHRERFGF